MCYMCPREFNSVELAISHLKIVHLVKELDINDKKCMVKNNMCLQKYALFSSLRRHIKECVKKQAVVVPVNNIENCVNNIGSNISNHDENVFEVSHVDIESIDNKLNDEVEFSYGSESDSQSVDQFLDDFVSDVMKLNVTHKVMDAIFALSEKLVQNVKKTTCDQILRNNQMSAVDIFKSHCDYLSKKLHSVNSQPKRKALFKKNPNFIEPEEKRIGFHWEMKRNPTTHEMLAEPTQSKFQYVPITKTLIALFDQPEFKDLYMSYNYGNSSTIQNVRSKHVCESGRYIDYCCGKVFKENALFSAAPNSIQIQLFIDGFNVCDALKSSSTIHNQVAIYFVIRNLPHEYAYNLNNIHLVALAHANDLKNKHTDYNNLWDEVVKDIWKFERIGVVIDKNTTERGNKTSF